MVEQTGQEFLLGSGEDAAGEVERVGELSLGENVIACDALEGSDDSFRVMFDAGQPGRPAVAILLCDERSMSVDKIFGTCPALSEASAVRVSRYGTHVIPYGLQTADCSVGNTTVVVGSDIDVDRGRRWVGCSGKDVGRITNTDGGEGVEDPHGYQVEAAVLAC